MSHLLVLGHGYSSAATLEGLDPAFRVTVTARSPAKIAALAAGGLEVIGYDGLAPAPALAEALRRATHLLITAAPDARGDPLLQRHRADVLASTTLRWIGYLSTVGVYGDTGGAWIDETTAPNNASERARARIAAEGDWRAVGAAIGAAVQLFRLGGIYGPGRNALIDVAGGHARRIVKPGQVFNRIHVADIGGMVRAGMARPLAGPVLNVVDGNPSSPQEVVEEAARLLGVAPPPEVPFERANLSPMGRSFYSENRRVSNAATLAALGFTPLYPTYREGLAALHTARDWERAPPMDA